MAEREVRIKFTGDTGVLKGQAGELRTLFANLVNDTDDVRDAGAKWADAYSQQSQRIRREMDDITTSAAVLADSMGPEMVAALEQSGRSVEEQVQELIKLGLTHDDIRVSSDELAAAIRERDDVLRQSSGEVGDGFAKVRDETQKATDVMHSFAGNAVAELPMVTETFGPLGEATSQMVEGLLNGEVGFKSLLTTAAGIGVVTLVMKQLSDSNAAAAQRAEEAAKAAEHMGQVYADALTSGRSVTNAFIEELENARQLMVYTSISGARNIGTDLIPVLNSAGISASQFARAVQGSAEQQAAFRKAIEESGVPGYLTILKGLTDQTAIYNASQKLSTEMQTILRLTQEDVNEAFDDFLDKRDPIAQFPDEFRRIADAMANDAAPAAKDLNTVTDGLGLTTEEAMQIASSYADTLRTEQVDALDRARQAAEDAEQAERDLMDARRSAIDTAYRVTDAQDTLTEAIERALSAEDDNKTSVDEFRQAQDDAAQAALALADAVVADAQAKAELRGSTLSATEANQLMIESLYTTLLTLDPNSALAAAIRDHIARLQGIPETKGTIVTVAGDPDVIVKLGGLQSAAEDVPDTVETDAAADVDEALGQIDDLTVAIEGVPTEHTTTFLVETAVALAKVQTLKRALDDLAESARIAEREVSRVAD